MTVLGVGPIHVVTFLIGHHFEGQLVVVAEEQAPLAGLRDDRRLGHDVVDREPIFLVQGHEQSRHQREMERHVALVALAEVGDRVLGPLVGLGQEHPSRIAGVDMLAEGLEELMGLGQVLAVGSLALIEIGHGIQPQPVDPQLEPEIDDGENGRPDRRIVEVEVGLMGVEPVPVIGLGDRVPAPVRGLEVLEDHPGVLVLLGGIVPHVEIAFRAAGRGAPGALEPGMLVGRVIQHQLGDDPNTTVMRRFEEGLEVLELPILRVECWCSPRYRNRRPSRARDRTARARSP